MTEGRMNVVTAAAVPVLHEEVARVALPAAALVEHLRQPRPGPRMVQGARQDAEELERLLCELEAALGCAATHQGER